jgi:hypothetical protein
LALGLASCGESDEATADDNAHEAYFRTLSETLCHLSYLCCSTEALANPFVGSSERECLDLNTAFGRALAAPKLEASIAAGRVVFRPEAMHACIAALNEAGCAATDEQWLCSTDALNGQVELGGECTDDFDCANRNCVGASDSEPGTCEGWKANGEPCQSYLDCESGRCSSFTDGTCVPRLAGGSECITHADCATFNCVADTRLCGPSLDDNGCPLDGLLLDDDSPAGAWH